MFRSKFACTGREKTRISKNTIIEPGEKDDVLSS